MSLRLLEAVKTFKIRHRPNKQLQLRIGLNTGKKKDRGREWKGGEIPLAEKKRSLFPPFPRPKAPGRKMDVEARYNKNGGRVENGQRGGKGGAPSSIPPHSQLSESWRKRRRL